MSYFSSPTLAALLYLLVASSSIEAVLFSSLPQTLVVSASPKPGQVLKAGEDKISVSWGLNQSLTAGADGEYKTVKIRLCYAPVSQVDRAWRKTNNDLSKDKACQFGITIQPYQKKQQSLEYTVEREIPTATYFIRAYVFDSGDNQVGYGQTTDGHNNKTTNNLFLVQGITGRHASLEIAAGCFSAFSVVSLVTFFMIEKRKVNK